MTTLKTFWVMTVEDAHAGHDSWRVLFSASVIAFAAAVVTAGLVR